MTCNGIGRPIVAEGVARQRMPQGCVTFSRKNPRLALVGKSRQ